MALGCVRVWVDMDDGVPPCGGVAGQCVRPCNLKLQRAQSLHWYISDRINLRLQMM